jgi:hypothetical protein
MGLARPDPKRKFKWKLIYEFQGFLEFGKTLGKFTWGLRGNLHTRIFPKFF